MPLEEWRKKKTTQPTDQVPNKLTDQVNDAERKLIMCIGEQENHGSCRNNESSPYIVNITAYLP